MFFNNTSASPRKSFSVPINITLQGARRRQTREVSQSAAAPEQGRRHGGDGRGEEKAKAQTQVSSVGEDRAVLLGFTMMAFSVLMYFVVGITAVKPYLSGRWDVVTSCVLLQADVLEEWVDCLGVSTVPCLKVAVNLTSSGQRALLHHDEESVRITPECFYTPTCHMDKAELQEEVLTIKSKLENRQGSTFACLADPERHPQDTILTRSHTLSLTLMALLWPSLMLGGGILLLGLIKLNQCLAHLCSELGSQDADSRLSSRVTQGTQYRLLRWRAGHSHLEDLTK
ncbi:calcium-activated potassium channel subunit beta-3 [Aplochiton taeniatus]